MRGHGGREMLNWGDDDEDARIGLPYFCPGGHDFTRLMTVDEAAAADVSWPCPHCDAEATMTPPGEGDDLGDLRLRPLHWQQVQQRRTTTELDALLAEGLTRAPGI